MAQNALCARTDHSNKKQNLLEDHMNRFKEKLTIPNLSVDDMTQAEEAIVYVVQEHCFQK